MSVGEVGSEGWSLREGLKVGEGCGVFVDVVFVRRFEFMYLAFMKQNVAFVREMIEDMDVRHQGREPQHDPHPLLRL